MTKLISTNIRWIPFISSDFRLVRVKDLFYRSKIEAHLENPIILSLARDKVKVRDISNNEGQLAESYYNYNVVKSGDLLLNPMDLYSGANCNMSEKDGVISQAYINLRKKEDINPKFYDFFFKTQYWSMSMFAHGRGVSFDNRWTLNNETLMNMMIPYTDIKNQNTIVDYLNKKLKCIDDIIANNLAQISKMEFYIDSFIQRTVKKLYLTCTTVPIKYLFDVISGSTPKSGIPEFWNGDIVWFTPSDFKGNKVLVDSQRKITLEGFNSCALKIAPKNSILITKRAPIGNIALSSTDFCINQGCLALTNKNTSKINTEFYYYLLKSSKEKLQSLGNGTTFFEISHTNFSNFKVPLIDKNKQDELVSRVSKIQDTISKLIENKKEQNILLEKYRRSLIYECVTGKKEINI